MNVNQRRSDQNKVSSSKTFYFVNCRNSIATREKKIDKQLPNLRKLEDQSDVSSKKVLEQQQNSVSLVTNSSKSVKVCKT